MATAAVAVSAGAPAAAQHPAAARVEVLQAEIEQLQEEIATLKADIAKGQRQPGSSAKQAAASEAPHSDAPVFQMSSNNRPTICSSDGRNCIALTGRLDLDFGGYDYRPDTAATTPQDLVGGVIARRARIGITGKFLDDWDFSVVIDGGGSGGASSATLDKAYLTYSGFKPVKIWGGILTVPYTLDRATSSSNMTFMERAAPLEVAAGIGATTRSAVGITSNGRRWWAGAFVTGPEADKISHDSGQAAVTARAVFMPVLASHGSLLIGGDVQYLFNAPTGGSELNLRDRIELRIDGNRILGTGPLPIHSARVLSGELAGAFRSFHFQGEYFNFNVERTRGSGPSLGFNGYYAQGGYILTGEKRSYSASSGSYGGVVPNHPFDPRSGGWGALEIAARYSMIDLNDKDIFGGRQENVTLGLNWYANSNIRLMLDYINGKVDKRTAGGVDAGAKYSAIGVRAQIAF
ncbi:MAG TPA: porin [Sphingomicrobium sp.]|nr:porin [Sphingomicrobium sp.]